MKYLKLIFLIILTMPLFSAGKVNKPDFAYPKTVVKDAKADLKKALSKNDAHQALNALIREYLAETLIDEAKAQEMIELTNSVAQRFADSPLQGVFTALLGKMYLDVYQENPWTYDRRELPMTPLPADITEWSGAQFKQKIKELATASYAHAEQLNQLRIQDYEDLISIDREDMPFFPTVLDFVYCNANSLLQSIDEGTDFAEVPLANSNLKFGARLYWNTQNLLNEVFFLRDASLKEYYTEVKDNELGGYVLSELCEQTNFYNENIELPAWAVKEIDEYVKKFPSSQFNKTLQEFKRYLLQIKVTAEVPNYCEPGMPFTVTVSNRSANNSTLRIYKLPSISINNYYQETPENNKLIRSIQVGNAQEAPFYEKTEIEITLDEPGAYLIVPEIPNPESGRPRLLITRCVPAYPIAFNQCDKAYIATVAPNSGSPIPNVKVYLSRDKDKNSIFAGTTDSKGLIEFSKTLKNNKLTSGYVSLEVNGIRYPFNVRALSQSITDEHTSTLGTIMTDRSIYHPGDSIHAVAVLYKHTTNTDYSQDVKVAPKVRVIGTLYDVNDQPVDTVYGKTDNLGRCTFDFVAPDNGLTGDFTICVSTSSFNNAVGTTSVTVSDYRMPEFEIKDFTSARMPEALDTVLVKGRLMSYSGFPMIGAQVNLTIRKASWFRWFSPKQSVYSDETQTDDQGWFNLQVPVAELDNNEFWKFYLAQIECTSESGSTADASAPFSLGKQYQINLNSIPSQINGAEPFVPNVKVYDVNGEETKIALRWQLVQDKDTIMQGNIGESIDLKNVKPGQYEFKVESQDSSLADEASTNFTLYNPDTDIVPGMKPLWVRDNGIDPTTADQDGNINLLIGCKDNNTYFYYTISSTNILHTIELEKETQGYHNLKIALPEGFEQGMINLIGVRDNDSYNISIPVKGPVKTVLKIEGSSWRDLLVPGQQETWNLKVVDYLGQPVQAAVVLDMFNKALDAIMPHSLSLSSRRYNMNSTFSVSIPSFQTIYNSVQSKSISMPTYDIEPPKFNFYGEDENNYYKTPLRGRLRLMKMSNAALCESAVYADDLSAPMTGGKCDDSLEESVVSEETEGEAATTVQESESFDYRDAEVPLAVWAPQLTTDAEGVLNYTFTVPNANTTWRLNAVAWTQNMEIGSLIRDFVANKPIMVSPQTPRFMRAGDRALIKASVMNNSDSAVVANSVIEFFNPVTNQVISSEKFTDEISAMGSVVISAWIEATDQMTAIGYRVRTTNGTFSDGEQGAMQVLPAEASLIETTPFYLNLSETEYSMRLPEGKDAQLSLTFSENPAWAVVSALPGLRQNILPTANSAAAAIFAAATSRGLMSENPHLAQAIQEWIENPSDSMLISSLEKNEDLKLALLNCTPWVQAAQSDTERMANLALIFSNKEIKQSISKGIEQLKKLQREDGGWAWGSWAKESSEWITSNVLSMMAELIEFGWLPDDKDLNEVIIDALKFWDSKMKAKETDMVYARIRPIFKDVTISLNGQGCITTTVNYILKNWKSMSNPAEKAIAAEVLFVNNYPAKAKELMGSVSEFSTLTKSQGIKFANNNALYNYAILLGAYCMITDDTQMIDGLRQQLIVRKQGSDWGNSVVTMEIVKAILTSGTRWTVPAQGASITCGDSLIEPTNAVEKYSGSLRADLSPYAGDELKIMTSGVGPAYGAVYAQFKQNMADVKSVSCDDLSIEKSYAVKRGTEWDYAMDSLKIGDRVKVVLTIHCQRNLSYVTIIDELAAALQPVDQVPGWIWSEGVAFYRECRNTFTGLYVDYMSPGTYQLTYELTVNNAGAYSGGVASIQSQYAPELAAHSAGTCLRVGL